MADDAAIVRPTDIVGAGAELGGAGLIIFADLPEGGFVQIIPGTNPLAQAMPGPQIPPGFMLAAVPPEIANQLRATMRQVKLAQSGINGKVNGG